MIRKYPFKYHPNICFPATNIIQLYKIYKTIKKDKEMYIKNNFIIKTIKNNSNCTYDRYWIRVFIRNLTSVKVKAGIWKTK